MSFTPSAAPGTGPGTREPANALRPRKGGIPENDAGYRRRLARHPASRCWCRVSHSLQSTPEPGLFESFGSGKQNALGSDEFMLGGASVSARFTSLPQTTFLLTGLPDAGLALRDWARDNRYAVELLESFIAENKNETFNDCVMVFTKGGQPPSVSLAERCGSAINVRSWPQLDELRRRRDQW